MYCNHSASVDRGALAELDLLITELRVCRLELILFGKANFNPSQPRVPAGRPEGGQWTDQPYPDAIEEAYPEDVLLGGLLGGRAIAAARRALQKVRRRKPEEGAWTEHGAERSSQRHVTEKQIEKAIRSAEETGSVTTKTGKYGTPQKHYKGSNGVTVVIETSGRNAGKVITVWRH